MNYSSKSQTRRGSVVLVALCFVVVLGIALASYLAVSTQAMKLSNRSYLKNVSDQLAEAGLEQALAAFNRNDWDPTVWAITGTTATRTISFPATKYGNGTTGSVRIRVDNYDAYNRPSIWSATGIYRLGDLVGYTDGHWYRCIKPLANKVPPDLSCWAELSIPWQGQGYTAYKTSSPTSNTSIVCNGGTWLKCDSDQPATNPSFSPTGWSFIPTPSIGWNASVNYSTNAFVFENGVWYRSIAATNTGNAPPNPSFWSTTWSPGTPYISWAYRSGVTYGFNDVVYCSTGPGLGGAWYRCIRISPSPGVPPDGWEPVTNLWDWSSTLAYNLNDVVYYGGSYYRCVLANTGQQPPNSTYWSPSPLLSPTWDVGRQYSQYDTVLYNGSWYLNVWPGPGSNTGKVPVINTDIVSAYWALAPQSIAEWDSTRNYNINDMVSSGGVWYRCVAPPTTNQPTTNTAYWSPTISASYQWNATTNYAANTRVSYGGVWYKSIVGNTNQAPNNPTFWATLGAPVIYTEGAATPPDGSTPITTQLRGTPAKAPLFPNAAAATSTLKISTSGIVDSYDGSVYLKTPQGIDRVYAWNDTASPPPPFSAANPDVGYSATLASTANASPSITITAARVNGYVAATAAATSPFSPLWNYSSGSAILTGTLAGTGVDFARASRSPYIPQFDILPSSDLSSAFTLANFPKGVAIPAPIASDTSINLGTPGATIPSIYYFDGNFRLQSGSASYYKNISINGPVILYINGYLRIQSGGMIEIKNTGSAEIHCDYLRSYTGSDGIFNHTLDPKKLIVLGGSSAFNATYLDNGASPLNTDFYGVIYEPNTTATLGLDVRTGVRVFGALSCRKITFSTEATLHYDTSLRYATFGGLNTPFILSDWRELAAENEKAVLP